MSIIMCSQKFNNSYNDANELLNDLFTASKERGQILYRGISYDAEKYPKIMRVRDEEEYINMKNLEASLLKSFRKYATSLMGSNYGIIDLLCYAQHFGIPTRLLDWSYDPFVALFFCLSAKPNITKDDFQYRLLLCNINRQMVIDDLPYSPPAADIDIKRSDDRVDIFEYFTDLISQEEFIEDFCKKEKRKIPQGGLLILETNESNPRINAQKGLFSIPKYLEKDMIDLENKKAGIKTIMIEEKARTETLKLLKNMGYEKRRLFFDLQSVCESIVDENINSKECVSFFADSDLPNDLLPKKVRYSSNSN